MTKLETYCNLGLTRDPFKGQQYSTGDSLRVQRILQMAINSRAMVSIVGIRGIGKTEAVNAALGKMKVRISRVEKLDKENLTIADIRTALMTDLSTEAIKRGGEISSRQLRRIIGEAASDKNRTIVLVIEEAQRLHPNTLKSLKTLREIEWLGEKELFAIVLVAQSDPMNRPGVSEVSLRSDCVRMQGISADEACGYLRATVGRFFDDAAMDALGELPAARNYLELQALAVEMLNVALADGRAIVTLEDVQSAVARQSQALPKGPEKRQAAAISGKGALANVLTRAGDIKVAANA
jgi:type II secretory pathway predicted ATPase ExeA